MKSTLWFFICSCLSLFIAPVLTAQASEVFTVSGVKVNIKAENAVEAKEKAFVEARKLAFDKLSQRLLTESEVAALPEPSDLEISSMIRNFEIVSENLAPKQYKGEFSYTFKEEAVRRFFEGGGYRFSDISGDTLLVLPYFQKDGQSALWDETNPWYNAWQKVDTYSEGLVPVLVPLGDAQDIEDTNSNQPLEYDLERLQALADRYKAKSVVISILGVTGNEEKVHLYRVDGATPTHVKSFNLAESPFTGNEDADKEVLRNAVRDVYAFLQREWKQQTSISSNAQKASLQLGVSFNDLSEWVRMRSALDTVAAVDSYDVISLKPGHADIRLNYTGSYERLSLALEGKGLYVEQPDIRGYYDESGAYKVYQGNGQKPMLRMR